MYDTWGNYGSVYMRNYAAEVRGAGGVYEEGGGFYGEVV